MSDDETKPKGADTSGPKPSANLYENKKDWKGKEKKRAWGDRKPKPEDPSKPATPKPAGSEKPEPSKPQLPAPKLEVGWKPRFEGKFSAGPYATTKEGDDDKTFVEALTAKGSIQAFGGTADLLGGTAKLTLVNAKVEATAAHAQIDLVEFIGDLLFGKKPKPPAVPSGPMTPMAARFMDLTAHGIPFMPGPGSTNVSIESMPALRAKLDQLLCTAPGAAAHGGGPAMLGEPTVFINSMPAIRVGDYVLEPTGGANLIVKGAATVSIGSPAGPPPAPPPPKPEEPPWVIFESVAKADAGTGQAELKVDGNVDLAQRKGALAGQIGASVALLKGELPLKVRLRIPFTEAYLGLGVVASGTLGSLGAEAGGSIKVNEKNEKTGQTKWFASSGGASVAAGVGGVGLKFSVDVASR
ncbi:MAG: hypothetical protein RL701_1409 [Pseudomonadota bacterium]|jgi:uncharacterized Zn-binding protein involved in type VI secretion